MGEHGVLEQRGFSASAFPGELPSATGKGRVVRVLLGSPFTSTSMLGTRLRTPKSKQTQVRRQEDTAPGQEREQWKTHCTAQIPVHTDPCLCPQIRAGEKDALPLCTQDLPGSSKSSRSFAERIRQTRKENGVLLQVIDFSVQAHKNLLLGTLRNSVQIPTVDKHA